MIIPLGGDTLRVDPATTKTAYVRVTLVTAQVYDEAGNINQPARVMELYVTQEDARKAAIVFEAALYQEKS